MAILNRIDIPLAGNGTPELVTFSLGPKEKGHFALVFNNKSDAGPRLVRVHSSCDTGDIFGSQLCDCGPQKEEGIRLCKEAGGVFIYLKQEGRGIGLEAKIAAYELQQSCGLDTFEANKALGHAEDERSYASAAHMLKDLNVRQIRLLTNNPDKAQQLRENGIDVTEVVPTSVYANTYNQRYLDAKREHGHLLHLAQG